MIKILVLFTFASFINVMLNTFKTIIMYRNEKLSSSLINAITYSVYCVVVVLMAGNMPLWLKVGITAGTNFIGVWLSMIIMEKFHKDKLWEVRATIYEGNYEKIETLLNSYCVRYTKVDTSDSAHRIYNIYCPDQQASKTVKDILNRLGAQYFVSEGKIL